LTALDLLRSHIALFVLQCAAAHDHYLDQSTFCMYSICLYIYIIYIYTYSINIYISTVCIYICIIITAISYPALRRRSRDRPAGIGHRRGRSDSDTCSPTASSSWEPSAVHGD
jgi:hypothetical protein